jgi:hypothetical protein
MEWYTQPAVQGLAVMALLALAKAICFWAGKPLSDTAIAKVGKLLTVAAATAAATILTTGATGAFWPAWAGALVTAIGSWEILSKSYYGLSAPTPDTEPKEDE